MRGNRWKLGALALVVLGVVALAGCGGGGSSTGSSGTSTGEGGEGGGEESANIAFFVVGYSEFQQAQEKGIKNAQQELGGSIHMFSSNFDPTKLTSQCTDAVNSGQYNFIILDPPASPDGVPCATVANKAGIPVIGNYIPTGPDPEKTESQVEGVEGGIYLTPLANAETYWKTVEKACEGFSPCNVIAEQGTPSENFINRWIEGAEEEVPGVKIIAKYPTEYDQAEVTKQLPNILAAHPEVNVYVATADNTAVVAAKVLKQAGLNDVKVVGSGASAEGVKAVENGELFITTGNWPVQEGEIMAKMGSEIVNGKTPNPNIVVASEIDEPLIVTKENVSEVTPEWGATEE